MIKAPTVRQDPRASQDDASEGSKVVVSGLQRQEALPTPPPPERSPLRNPKGTVKETLNPKSPNNPISPRSFIGPVYPISPMKPLSKPSHPKGLVSAIY